MVHPEIVTPPAGVAAHVRKDPSARAPGRIAKGSSKWSTLPARRYGRDAATVNFKNDYNIFFKKGPPTPIHEGCAGFQDIRVAKLYRSMRTRCNRHATRQSRVTPSEPGRSTLRQFCTTINRGRPGVRSRRAPGVLVDHEEPLPVRRNVERPGARIHVVRIRLDEVPGLAGRNVGSVSMATRIRPLNVLKKQLVPIGSPERVGAAAG